MYTNLCEDILICDYMHKYIEALLSFCRCSTDIIVFMNSNPPIFATIEIISWSFHPGFTGYELFVSSVGIYSNRLFITVLNSSQYSIDDRQFIWLLRLSLMTTLRLAFGSYALFNYLISVQNVDHYMYDQNHCFTVYLHTTFLPFI